MGRGRTPGPIGVDDAQAFMCRPAWPGEVMSGGPGPGPVGMEDAADLLMCMLPGPLGHNYEEDDLARAGMQSAGRPSMEAPDAECLVVESVPLTGDAEHGTGFALSVEALLKWSFKERTNLPGALADMKTFVAYLREFGVESVRVHKGQRPSTAGKFYLVFKGNPRKPGLRTGLRNMIRGNGPYSFKHPNIVQLGLGSRNALRSGARATVLSFIVVAAVDVVEELLQDDVALARLGVNLGVDTVKLILSLFGSAVVSGFAIGGLAAFGVSVPVVAVAVFAGVAAWGVGKALDYGDLQLGITRALQEYAATAQARLAWGAQELLRQLQWCAMHPNGCF